MKYEIFVGDNSTYFDYGYAVLEDDFAVDLCTYVNVGIRQDSVIIGIQDEFGEIDDHLRWFPKPGVIEFYYWDKNNLEAITFHNRSQHPIYICGCTYLSAGESKEIKYTASSPHSSFLSRMDLIGMVRLIEADEHKKLIDKEGLLLSAMNEADAFKENIRFVPSELLKDEETELLPFDVNGGRIAYEDSDRIVFRADDREYVFGKAF